MIVRKTLYAAAGATALVVATIATAPLADARCVDERFSGRASGLLRATAGIAARADWRAEVRRHVGSDFALWRYARDRVTRCYKPESGTWRCYARARPCNR
jgi:hypothetical protein